jgi:hypothetical protein
MEKKRKEVEKEKKFEAFLFSEARAEGGERERRVVRAPS